MLYRVSVESALSVWNTHKRREFARQAVKTRRYISSASSHTAVLGLCPQWMPWDLRAVKTTLPAPLAVKLSRFSPPTTSPTFQCLGWSLFTPHFMAGYNHMVDGVWLLWLGKILSVLASRRGSHSCQVSWAPGILISLPWSGHSFVSSCKSNKDIPSSSGLWTPHLTHDTPIYRVLFSEDISWPLPNTIKINGLEICVQFSKNFALNTAIEESLVQWQKWWLAWMMTNSDNWP